MKNCNFCQQKVKEIDFKDTGLLRQFISSQSKILSPRYTNICAKHQRKLARAIKRARVMGLLPFTRS